MAGKPGQHAPPLSGSQIDALSTLLSSTRHDLSKTRQLATAALALAVIQLAGLLVVALVACIRMCVRRRKEKAYNGEVPPNFRSAELSVSSVPTPQRPLPGAGGVGKGSDGADAINGGSSFYSHQYQPEFMRGHANGNGNGNVPV